MIKNKKILLSALLLASFLEAKSLLNGVSVIVEEEPITLYEIHRLSKQENISLNKALDVLITNSLKNSQIKKLGIQASEFEINQEIKKIADKNNMSIDEFLEMINSDGVDRDEYREKVSENIKSGKLFQKIFMQKKYDISDAEIKKFYEENRDRFSQIGEFAVSVYRAKTKLELNEALKNPMAPNEGVSIEDKNLNSSSISKRELYFLNQTPIGKFTPPIQVEDGYVSYLVNDKIGSKNLPFEDAKPLAKEYLLKSKEQELIENYFEKLKADAHIEILRRP